jgi:nicotinamide-nucleotide amidase
LANFLASSHSQVVTAESCAGGGVAQILTHIPGSSSWFDRGFITDSSLQKKMLVVDLRIIEQYGAVNYQVASLMATYNISHADYAIAITGIAGPTGGSHEKPVGTVYIAIEKQQSEAIINLEHFSGNRTEIRAQAILKAL